MLAVHTLSAPTGATPEAPTQTPTPPPVAIEAWYKDPVIWLGVGIGVVAVTATTWGIYRALR